MNILTFAIKACIVAGFICLCGSLVLAVNGNDAYPRFLVMAFLSGLGTGVLLIGKGCSDGNLDD